MLRLIVATHNPNKAKEIKDFFKGYPVEVVSMKELGIEEDIEEYGNTIEENALIKARFLRDKVKEGIVIADDTGLFVEYLGGQPGVYSARFAGENATYEENNRKLLKLLEGVPYEKRKAYFKTIIAVIEGEKEVLLEGVLEGHILDHLQGENGFGYDPVFFVDGIGKTLAELSLEEKNKISHRGKALLKLKEYILKRLEEN
ncbi:MAG: Non-canonical purine NTP pyrophosphatase [Caldanaerobacter subterraneus]|uniref:dITP/XTP pyrophosphatase n=2 Tax=Caldanaerobacter subterraneus TaxID=911092 RepID=U5CUZ3_CALSX|nr:NTP phosphatase [Caldanaerobacter subterraneus subsp. yonseiensis KB-1]KKC30313.1 xanthosine triphosphate pyrophosphatase [Caldanaerobacter subterraneus subsp. pacificus DSM 12653]KUK09110.1 MAG: Non-canonical purine NTP pyrophosphatase [Caldanaerobacter subterraneus]